MLRSPSMIPTAVDTFQVTVDLEMPCSALDQRPDDWSLLEAMLLLLRPQQLAADIATGVVGWVRLGLDQVGLGLRRALVSAESSRLFDLEARRLHGLASRRQGYGSPASRPSSRGRACR